VSPSASADCAGRWALGVVVVLPGIDKLVRVDLRTVTLTIPPQEVITRDNVTARVNAVALSGGARLWWHFHREDAAES
jgi:hypothetical protein